jgi:hypothetical protein
MAHIMNRNQSFANGNGKRVSENETSHAASSQHFALLDITRKKKIIIIIIIIKFPTMLYKGQHNSSFFPTDITGKMKFFLN